jgi:hypothetical protein
MRIQFFPLPCGRRVGGSSWSSTPEFCSFSSSPAPNIFILWSNLFVGHKCLAEESPGSKEPIFFQGYVMDRRISFIEEGPSGQSTTRSTQVSRTQLHAAYFRTARKKGKHTRTTRQASTYPLERARPWRGLQPSTVQLPTVWCERPWTMMVLRLRRR